MKQLALKQKRINKNFRVYHQMQWSARFYRFFLTFVFSGNERLKAANEAITLLENDLKKFQALNFEFDLKPFKAWIFQVIFASSVMAAFASFILSLFVFSVDL